MRDANRIGPILEKLKKVWEKQPDTRLGQLIYNLPKDERDIFFIEDDELEEMLDEVLREEKK
jgi:uncharacterized protein YihD (DUF1040 family)